MLLINCPALHHPAANTSQVNPGFKPDQFQENVKSRNICKFNRIALRSFLCVGSFPELLGPIFEKLKSILPDCAQGYVQTMIMYMGDVDEAFKCSDTRALSIWFKIYPTMFSMVLPFVDDDSIRDVITNGVCDSKALLAQLSKGNLDLKSMQDFFGKVSTAMNDSLNNYCPPKPCLPPRRPLLGL